MLGSGLGSGSGSGLGSGSVLGSVSSVQVSVTGPGLVLGSGSG